MRAPAQIQPPTTGAEPAGPAPAREPDRSPQAPGAPGSPALPDTRPAESGTRQDGLRKERCAGDGHLGRLLSGMLPGGSFLPPGDLVVVDVETTGWLADAAGITEIGAVRLGAGRPVAEFSALVNPGRPIPAHISELTGITDAMVSDAPGIAEVLPAFLNFAGSGVIVAHNAAFDIGFLAAAAAECGITWPARAVIDTAVLSR